MPTDGLRSSSILTHPFCPFACVLFHGFLVDGLQHIRLVSISQLHHLSRAQGRKRMRIAVQLSQIGIPLDRESDDDTQQIVRLSWRVGGESGKSIMQVLWEIGVGRVLKLRAVLEDESQLRKQVR